MDPDVRRTIAEALDLLPKVELHCHIEGTMRAETLVELSAREGHTLRTTEPAELYRYESLDGFLELFWLAQSWHRYARYRSLESSDRLIHTKKGDRFGGAQRMRPGG